MSHLFDFAGWGTSVTILRQPAPTIGGGPDGHEGEITFLISPLSQIGPFLTHCAGFLEDVPIAGGGTVERRVPLIHPDDPDMYIESYTIEYFGRPMSESWAPGKSIHTEQFSHARMRSYFRTLPLGVGPDQQFYTIDIETGATVETVPGGAMKTATNRPLTGDFGLTIPTSNLVVTTFMSPTPISYAIHQMVGKVNSTEFTDPEIGNFPIGTLRFQGVKQATSRGSTGRTLVKSFNLGYREELWNKVLNDVGVWEFAYTVSGGLMKYKSADLNILKTA